MKYVEKIMILFLCIMFLTGCDNGGSGEKGIKSTNSVDEVINKQINTGEENSTNETVESNEYFVGDETKEDVVNNNKKGDVDYDLTQMSSDMVYGTVYQMMIEPKEYEGKKFRIDGNFYASYYKKTKKYYFYCVIKDATACCAQGLEFVWKDGTHIYPDDYPKENAKIVVEGTFETYKEKGDKNLYYRLSNATLKDNMK